MIFHSALVRELRSNAGIVFATLLTIILSTTLIRVLGQAASGRTDELLVLPLIALSTATSLPLLVSLTAFLAILLVLGRWWRDSEMVVWFASGVGIWSLVRPIWTFLWPFVLAAGLCSLFLSPWARGQSEELTEAYKNRSNFQRISPGQFRESGDGRQVFFVESPETTANQLGKVFSVSNSPDGRMTVLFAQGGELTVDEQGRSWVTTKGGTRTDWNLKDGRFQEGLQAMQFSVYSLRADLPTNPLSSEVLTLRAVSTFALVGVDSPAHRGELAFRIGTPILALVLGLIAIPFSYVGQRTSRWYPLVFAILVVMISNNLLSVSQAWIAKGIVDFGWGWWPLPLAIALLFLALMWWRNGVRRSPLELAIRRLTRPKDDR